MLEGNTQRVFSRWAAVRAIPGEAPTTRLLWKIASAMLPREGAGTFNQAAMELGALVCLARNPQCDDCPVRGYCRARLEGRQNEIPGKVTRINYQPRTEFALVVREPKQPSDRYLLRPLPEGGRWAGLWDFPRTTNESFDSVGAAADSLAQETGLAFSPGMRLKTIKHAVTKYRIVLHVHQADLAPQAATKPPWRFVSLHEMADLPMSVTGREIAELLSSDRQQPLPLGTRHNV